MNSNWFKLVMKVTRIEYGKNLLLKGVPIVSRIFPKKNIKYALEVLSKITKGNVVFDIYGPIRNYGQQLSDCKADYQS